MSEFRCNYVLALYPFSRGFAFVLFEGPNNPFDWGVKDIKEKHRNEKTLDAIKSLIDRYNPDAIIIEETGIDGAKRSSRIRKLYRSLTHLCNTELIDLYRFPPSAIRRYFEPVGAVTKYEIAKAIGRAVPAFAHRMPKVRKPWMSTDPKQSLFDAAALGLVYYGRRGIPSPYEPTES